MAVLVHARARGAVRILWGLLVASVLIPVVLLLVAAWQSRESALQEARVAADRTTQTLYAQVENVFQTYELVMARLGDRVAGKRNEEIESSPEIHELLQQIATSYSQVGSIWIIDRDGVPLANSIRFPTRSAPMPDADFMIAFRHGSRDTFVSKPTTGRETGRKLINVSRPIFGSDGQFRGAIVISAYPAYFQARFASAAPELNYSAAIVGPDGVFLAREAASNSQPAGQHASSMFMKAAAEADRGQFIGVSTVDGVQRIVSYRKLGNYPVYVMFALGIDSVLAQWWHQVALFGAFALAAILGLGSMTYLALGRTRRAQEAAQVLMEETQRRKQTEAKLITAQKMEALGQLTGGIAHDFNNLLTVLMGNLDLLRRAKEERRSRLIDNGMHAVEQGRRLTQQLLAFGRRQHLRPEIIDVNALVANMSDMLTQSLRGDIKLELDLSHSLWPVEADPVQLQTALINLAANARDAMPRGGRFVVHTANSVLGDGAAVTISVSDTGTGMPPDVLERAVEPFFTTKEIGRGTGLGLSQVVGFIDQSGGTVDISSEVDRGTRVTLILPRANSKLAEASESAEHAEYEKKGVRLLLVEDNAQVRELAHSVLAEEGHEILEAAQAEHALEILESDQTIEFVFSDLVMPGKMDGLDLARAVRERYSHIPVVLATGYSDAAAKVLAEGFILVSKPYRPDILALTIRKVLAERTAVAEQIEAADNVVPISSGHTA